MVTDVLIFGNHYVFIFLSALITHNDLHLSDTLEENYICLHFPMLLKVKLVFIIINKDRLSNC